MLNYYVILLLLLILFSILKIQDLKPVSAITIEVKILQAVI